MMICNYERLESQLATKNPRLYDAKLNTIAMTLRQSMERQAKDEYPVVMGYHSGDKYCVRTLGEPLTVFNGMLNMLHVTSCALAKELAPEADDNSKALVCVLTEIINFFSDVREEVSAAADQDEYEPESEPECEPEPEPEEKFFTPEEIERARKAAFTLIRELFNDPATDDPLAESGSEEEQA